MNLYHRLLRAAVESWISILEAVGMRGTRWEWRKRAWRQSLEIRQAAWENLARGVHATSRMCRSCRALVEAGAATCPSCGESMRSVPRVGASRAMALLFPAGPSVSLLLVSANVLLMGAVVLAAGGGTEGGLAALWSPPGKVLYVLGAKWTAAIADGEWWRLVTAGYLHGGLIHLGMNCLALTTLGPLIEEAFGGRRLFILYSVSNVGALATSAYLHPGQLSIGASGAIYGLLAFAVVFGKWRGGPQGRALAAHLSQWLIYGVIMFFIPGIDSMAHLGGGLTGAALAFVLDPGEPHAPAARAGLSIATAACLVLTVGAFVEMMLAYQANVALVGR